MILKQKAPSQLRPFWSMAYFSLRAMLRNRATFAFGFLFPVAFIAVFGLIGGGGLTISIGIPDSEQQGPIYEALKQIKAVKLEPGTESSLRQKVSQGSIAAVLLQEEETSVPTLFISAASPQTAAAAQSLVSGIVDKLNLAQSGIIDPPLKLKVEEISGRAFRYIDFALPGIIGFALLGTAINGTAFGLIFLKKTLVLKRIFATPTKGLTILLGQGGARMIVALAQAAVILAIGVLAFDFQIVHGWLTLTEVFALTALGLVAFLGFGLIIAGIATDENTVAPLTSLIVLPQFLIGGTFFPIDSLPTWIQPLANVLPLSFFNTAVRKVTIEGVSPDQILPQLVGLAVWGIIAYLVAARTFRWE
ncbi:MAG TPA: ABC transporter permease [Candidatus Nanoarchaeia archaeon]